MRLSFPIVGLHSLTRPKISAIALTKLGLTITEIAEELGIDIVLVNQFVTNQNR